MKHLSLRILSGFLALIMSVTFTPFLSFIRRSFMPKADDGKVVVTEEMARAEYDKDRAMIKESIPGIVCWGDSLTAGAGGEGNSYPKQIEKNINGLILSKYDLKGKMNASDKSPVDWSTYTLKSPVVVNMGVGGERSNTICARAGVIPFLVDEFVIPEGKDKVEVRLLPQNGEEFLPLLQGDGGVNPVVIDGVKGKLSFEQTEDKVVYYFQRFADGDAVTVEKGTRMETATDGKYTDYITVIMMGGNGGFSTLDELFEQYDLLINRNEKNNDKYVIVGYHGRLGAIGKYANIDDLFEERYGEHYIRTLDLFVSKEDPERILNLARAYGLTPTEQDVIDIKKGVCPSCFLTDAVHFNSVGYEIVGNAVTDRMLELGYFDDILTGLGINK